MDKFEIRPMVAADLDQVIAIESAIYPHPWSRGNFADSLKADYDSSVCVRDDRILAYWLLMHAPDASHLLNFSIEPSHQRKGLGSRLLSHLLGVLRERRVEAVVLEVRPTNLGALSLYERAGFERIGIRRGYYPAADRQREDAVVMRRDLSRVEAFGGERDVG